MIGSFCIIVRRPKGEERSTLGIRTAWATQAGALETKMLFIEDGVYNLLKNPGYNTELLQNFIKEGGLVYAVSSYLEERRLLPERLLEGVQVIPEEEIPDLILECDACSTF